MWVSCTCVCVLYAPVCRCSGPCTYVEAREKCCLSCSTTLHLIPHSHWTWGYSGGKQAPAILLSLPQPQHWTYQHNVDTFAFLNMCSRDLNPGPCACMSNTWPSELSPQSQVLILFFFFFLETVAIHVCDVFVVFVGSQIAFIISSVVYWLK